jgi:antitoxin CptB
MLELDVLLLPFLEDEYRNLTEEQQALHRELLENEDPDLFMWFTTKERPIDPDTAAAVDLVLRLAKPGAR